MQRSLGLVAAALFLAVLLSPRGGIALAADSGGGQALEQHSGRYFRWAAPGGWRASESMSGVTLTSPDGRGEAALAMLLRSPGQTTPLAFLQGMLGRVPGYSNIRVLSTKNLPSQQMGYQSWQFIQAEVAYQDKGVPVTGVWKSGVANYAGMNDAMVVGYRAADPDLPKSRELLSRISQSIVLFNAAEAAGNDTLVKPQNNPLDSSPIIEAGKNRDAARDRSSQGWREGTMGAEPTYDPKTGRTYNSSFGDYDGARGGYVNPERPDENLQRGWPGYPKQ